MQEYFFANYRLLADEKIAKQETFKSLKAFEKPMPYTDTFIVQSGDLQLLDEKYDVAINEPDLCDTGKFTIHSVKEGWAICMPESERNPKMVVDCTKDFGVMTVYASQNMYFSRHRQEYRRKEIPFSQCIRVACESGMVYRQGLPLHAALIEKDGFGVVFLGPSGMGKSTQAKLWQKYLDADFVIGDRPGFRKINGKWYGCGMPWDGKDGIFKQKLVEIKAFISLEQAKENQIAKITEADAMSVLLRQTMMPMWDAKAMEYLSLLQWDLVKNMPFYHLKNKADEECVNLTYNTVFSGGINLSYGR